MYHTQHLLTDFSLLIVCCSDSCCIMAQVKNSRFELIRVSCLSSGVLYEDPEFPAVPESVYFSKSNFSIQWRRPVVRGGMTACA